MNNRNGKLLDTNTFRLVYILIAVSLVIAAMLGAVDYITKDAIAEGKASKTAAAMSEVLPAGSYEKLDAAAADGIVQSVYQAMEGAELKGWVVLAGPAGFGGTISMVVGIDTSGCVTGVSIITMTETSGLGANALKENFRSQYIGKQGSVSLSKYGGDIDALTGATITSKAVTDGVNAALNAVSGLIKVG
jgi:electron transport complex protein RnfG